MTIPPHLAPIKRITRRTVKALVSTGLLYASTKYDQERYEELRSISPQLPRKFVKHTLTETRV